MRILMFSTMLLAASTAWSQDQPAPPVPMAVTTGQAMVRRAPDVAFVTLAVETRAKTPREAQTLNATAMTAVQQKLLASGVARDAIRTLGYSIQQQFDYANGRQTPRDYLARNSIEVRLDVIDRTADVIDTGVAAGATAVSELRFDLKDRAGAEREALRLAVNDARARAEAIAAGAGRAIDRVLRVEDNRAGPEPPRPMFRTAMAAGGAAAETPIETGVIEIRQSVTLTVALK